MKTRYVAAAMASALALSTPASAGFFDLTLAPYLGASVGQAQADITCTAGTSCDDKDTAWRLFGGMEVNEYISMEVGYIDFGEATYTDLGEGSSGIRDTNGVTVNVVGTYVVSPSITLFGKGGMNFLGTSVKGTVVTSGSESDTDVEWSLGLGAQYNFTPTIGLRMEWERFFEVGSPDPTSTREADIDLISAGLVFKF
jgi:OmpA-OmpF porin, OOP family